jgi:hypothetical protein
LAANVNPNQGPCDGRCDAEPAGAGGEERRGDFLREMIGFAAQRLLEVDVENLTCRSFDLTGR